MSKNRPYGNSIELSRNSMVVLKSRYLLRDERGNIAETPQELFCRVAHAVAKAERHFKGATSPAEAEDKFIRMMASLEFLPNSPTLMNASTSFGQLSACFVLPINDSIDDIFNALRNMAKIHQTGGGTGFDFSHLRPKGDIVMSTRGQASGPVSFMSVFDRATEVIVQGGRRRGANMGILRCDHPDIVDFIESKQRAGAVSNFNISVGITDRFVRAVKTNTYFSLINPRNGKKTSRIKARALIDIIVNSAHRTGDPGLVFLDEINRKNPTPGIGRIEATNPCGELPLLPYESCNLASVNLAKMVGENGINWQKLGETVRWGIRFLDNVIEINHFPLPQIKKITLANRKIGLGVMGFADMLIKMGVSYDSPEAVVAAEKIMRFIRSESVRASSALSRERGVFPNFKHSVYAGKNIPMRNATVNTVAPTGTISIIAGCSSGIEPLFAISFMRSVLQGTKLFETNPLFEEAARKKSFYSKRLMSDIARQGSVQKMKHVPGDIKHLFATAFDISPVQHLKIQAAFQKHTDNSVSKTVNLPPDASVDDVRNIYLIAYKMKCKGITIYRYGSKPDQVLSLGYDPKKQEMITAGPEYAGGCLFRVCPF